MRDASTLTTKELGRLVRFQHAHEVEIGSRIARRWEDWWECQLDSMAVDMGELVIKV